MTSPENTALIALDWGTTSLRAYRLDADGCTQERRRAERGLLNLKNADFAAALHEIAGDWRRRAPRAPVLAAGMIGSRQGWCEVPYVEIPADLRAIAGGFGRVALNDGATLHIVPGLLSPGRHDAPDVMRGEETQILGAIGDGEVAACCILPGTHSKWARVADGRIAGFATFMTGELYAVLKAYSILGRTMADGAAAKDTFARGVASGFAADGLLHRLFSVRTLGLQGLLAAEDGADYLSGMLIGAEVREGLGWLGADAGMVPLLIGEGALVGRYAEALRLTGLTTRRAPEDAAAAGLFRLARAAQLIDP